MAKKRPVTSTLVDMDSSIETRSPNSESDLRTWYTVGPYSIMKNLPYPKVNTIKNDTHILIRKCVADFLGKGYLPIKKG